MMLPAKAKIVEVGPRDGLQNEKQIVSTKTKVELINQLSETGLRHIEVASFVSPKWIPQMADNSEVMQHIKQKAGVSYSALVPNLKGLENALDSGAKEIAIFAAASETFSQKNINCSIDESLKRFESVCKIAQVSGVSIRGYVSCVLGCPYEGDISSESVVRVASQMYDLGCYEISYGDTIGVGTPGSTYTLFESLLQQFPADKIAVHFHDTYGQALANVLATLTLGINIIDSSISGLGGCPYAPGAAGNVATEDIVYMLDGMGIETGIDLKMLVDISEYLAYTLKRPTRSRVSSAILAKNKMHKPKYSTGK